MKAASPADRVWRALVAAVMDSRDDWRRSAIAVTGLPFGRIRVLRRLADGPFTMREIAYAATMDAPAATVAVNDLEKRGLVVRRPHPTNRRAKLVSLTARGRDLVAKVAAIVERAPPALTNLTHDELAALERVVAALAPLRAR